MEYHFSFQQQYQDLQNGALPVRPKLFSFFGERAMFRESRNARSPHPAVGGIRGEGSPLADPKTLLKTMETTVKHRNSKGGRPSKEIKRNKSVTVHCSAFEQRLLKTKGKEAGMTVSEYLREIGLSGKIDRPKRDFPKEALALNGTLNHIAANLNQLAKKRNSGEEFDAYLSVKELQLCDQLKELTITIKTHFV